MSDSTVHIIHITPSDMAEDCDAIFGLSDVELDKELRRQQLTTIEGVYELMRSAPDQSTWDERRAAVEDANGDGFDEIWLDAVVARGLTTSVRCRWAADS